MNATRLYECWFCNWLLSLDAAKQKFTYFIIIIGNLRNKLYV
jgi:hypothetical protein